MLFKESDIFGTKVKLGSETVFKEFDLPEMMMNPWFVYESTQFARLLFDLADERMLLNESEYTDKIKANVTREVPIITEKDIFTQMNFLKAKNDIDRVTKGTDPFDAIEKYQKDNIAFITIVKQRNIEYNRDNTLRRIMFIMNPDYTKYTPTIATIIGFLASVAVYELFTGNIGLNEVFRDFKSIINNGSKLIAVKMKDKQLRTGILNHVSTALTQRSDYFNFGYRLCDPMRYEDFRTNIINAGLSFPSIKEGFYEEMINKKSTVIIVELIAKLRD